MPVCEKNCIMSELVGYNCSTGIAFTQFWSLTVKTLCQVAVQIGQKIPVLFQQVTLLLQAIRLLKKQTAGELAIHLVKLHQW